MSAPLAIAVFFTIWWVVLFAVLPIGVKSQYEAGKPADLPTGADPGAPVAPMLGRKALWTTLISAALFAGLYAYLAWSA
jgi:predicted secreted protein